MNIADFLLARITEDEALARPNICTSPSRVARMLAECAAKRRIVEHHSPLADEFVLCSIYTEVGHDAQMWPCLTLCALAAVYADHSDFQEEWRS